MTKSFQSKIEQELNNISEFKAAVTKVSSHLLELQEQRKDIYKIITNDMRSLEGFQDLLRKDTHGHVKEFRRILILELRYLEVIKRAFSDFKISLHNLLDNAPDKFDNDVLDAADNVYHDMIYMIKVFLENLTNNLAHQLLSTKTSKARYYLSFMKFFGNNSRMNMLDRFNNFKKDVLEENALRIKVTNDIQAKRRLLEKLMPEITKALKKKRIVVTNDSFHYEDVVKRYSDDADEGFKHLGSSFNPGESSISFGNLGSRSSGGSFGGFGGGSFGGGGAGGSW